MTAGGAPSKLQGIIPRWEWRTFGHVIGPAEAAFAAMTSTGIQESDETYLLTVAGGSAKVRDDLMDVKLLRETDADGLERWEPVMKASFPMSPDDVATVLDALGLGRPHDRPRPLHARRVRRGVRRRRRDPGGPGPQATRPLQGQRLHVRGDRRRRGRQAVEDDRDRIRGQGRGARGRSPDRPVGLPEHELPEGARRRSSTDRPERYAVIDVGTNSVKFHVAERDGAGFRPVVDRADVTRLGEGIQETGAIAPAAIERTVAAITGMVDEARARRRGRDRRRRHRRAADREQRGRRGRGGQGRDRRHDRRDLRRGREPAGLSRGRVEPRRRQRHVGRVRHRRRQLAVHLRPGRRASTSGSASTSAPSATRSGSGWTGRSARDVVDAGAGGDRRRPVAARRPPDARRAWSAWAAP